MKGDDYLASGKQVQGRIREELDTFFKGIRVSAIGGRLTAFREWRESSKEVLEYKQESIAKEVALQTMKAKSGRNKSLSATDTARIEKNATEWVENGVKATTDKRLRILRAIVRHAFKATQKIGRGDVPHFPILGTKVDNVKQNKFSKEDFENILTELPTYLHPLVKFLHFTGMRSGQAKAITWDMIGEDNVLRMSGFLTKNRKPYSLALTGSNGKPYAETAYLVNMNKENRLHGEPVFDTAALREEWRKACHKLKLGVYDESKRSYRGAQLHDFRRTAATNLINAGVAQTSAMSVTGHKTASMFARYGIEELDFQRAALDAVTR
ncbi:MAG TPA: tyrosine-type recombinase/integrase [Candidatus Eisenbacteria bacterium]|nr:tyrosine-type recombinase/integrase [Candidatus Eisenbacteria bacterium]